MSAKQKDSTIFWWIGWITLTIASFFVAAYLWTPVIARYAGPMNQKAAPILWVTAVFGSWLMMLVPLIILMYNKVDRAYENARINRENATTHKLAKEWGVKSVDIPEADRLLSPDLRAKIKQLPKAMLRGHLVDAKLRDGRLVRNVFILDEEQILGVYDYDLKPFTAHDIDDLLPANWDKVPVFTHDKWLRLDGQGS